MIDTIHNQDVLDSITNTMKTIYFFLDTAVERKPNGKINGIIHYKIPINYIQEGDNYFVEDWFMTRQQYHDKNNDKVEELSSPSDTSESNESSEDTEDTRTRLHRLFGTREIRIVSYDGKNVDIKTI